MVERDPADDPGNVGAPRDVQGGIGLVPELWECDPEPHRAVRASAAAPTNPARSPRAAATMSGEGRYRAPSIRPAEERRTRSSSSSPRTMSPPDTPINERARMVP